MFALRRVVFKRSPAPTASNESEVVPLGRLRSGTHVYDVHCLHFRMGFVDDRLYR